MNLRVYEGILELMLIEARPSGARQTTSALTKPIGKTQQKRELRIQFQHSHDLLERKKKKNNTQVGIFVDTKVPESSSAQFLNTFSDP